MDVPPDNIEQWYVDKNKNTAKPEISLKKEAPLIPEVTP
jgi:hypothetical protein